LFADPEQEYQAAVQFYQHDIDWTNRLILGDSLQVTSSLARREDLGGKVQMIYIDPPYGIKFASNFQPEVGKRDVKDREQDLTREPEMVKAYRDTWHLGINSYLTYLQDRLIVARELLADGGSIFVQIGDENIHWVRALLDEIFGKGNFVAQINFKTMMPLSSGNIESVYDYVLWYARSKGEMKYRNVFRRKDISEASEFSRRELSNGSTEMRSQTTDWDAEAEGVYKRSNLSSSGYTPSCTFKIEFAGRQYPPAQGKSWRTNREGIERLQIANRLVPIGTKLYYKLWSEPLRLDR